MTIQHFITQRMESGDYVRQYELAMELGINSAQLSHYRTGRSHQPTLDVAKKIHGAYNIVLWPYSLEGVTCELSEIRRREEQTGTN